MKLSEIRVRWYDVVFIVGFPGVYNYLFGMDGIFYAPGVLLMMSYIWFMSKRQRPKPDSDSDAASS